MGKIDASIELARYFDSKRVKKIITIKDYTEFTNKPDKDSISHMAYQRLHSRYLKPFLFNDKRFKREYKNGFSIMANCCLLIETLQSFRNGWRDSNGRSEQAFKDFFDRDKNFHELKSKGKDIYKNIRCSILHQGETCNGWKIGRSGKTFVDGKTISAITFSKRLEKSLMDYRDELKKSEWDSEIWDNFRVKMRQIIANCGE